MGKSQEGGGKLYKGGLELGSQWLTTKPIKKTKPNKRAGGRERGNEGDEGEGIRLIDFIDLYEIEQRNLLQLL
jgi:hypothetical protein